MIDTTTLLLKVNGYKKRCMRAKRQPTYKGVGSLLGISGSTVSNVVNGEFNGRRYTDKPHVSRCIDNKDFETIKALFGGEQHGK